MAFDAFLKIDGFPGESKDARHPDEIEIFSFSWGASNAAVISGGGGGGSGKVSFQDLNFTNPPHKSSPKLMLACATGQHIKNAVLTLRKAGGSPLDYIKVTLEDCMVSSYQQAGDTGGDRPVEQVSLNFAKIEFSYTEQKPDGSAGTVTTAGWDIVANKAT
jgi:type VI secretion system secreted protein Hcp